MVSTSTTVEPGTCREMGITVALPVTVGEALAAPPALGEVEGVPPPAAVGEPLGVGDLLGVTLGVPDLEGEVEGVTPPAAVGERLGDTVGVGVAPPAVGKADPVLEPLGVGVLLVEVVIVRVGEAPELSVGVAEGEASTWPCT